MSDDDPLFRLMERMCRLGEQLPSEEEVLHDENARHRAMMLVAEMGKIDKEVRAMGKRERERRAGRASSPRPGEDEPFEKETFCTKVGDQICGVGYYKK